MTTILKYSDKLFKMGDKMFYHNPIRAAARYVSTQVQLVNGRVDVWTDVSGNGKHLIAMAAAERPYYSEEYFKGLPYLQFSGGQQLLSYDGTFNALVNDLCFIWVGRSLATASMATFTKSAIGESNYEYFADQNTVYLRWSPGDNVHSDSPFVLNSDIAVYRVESNYSTMRMKVLRNGVVGLERNISSRGQSDYPFRVGAFQTSPTASTGTRFLRGVMAELVFLKNANEATKLNIEQELIDKYL